MGIVCTFRLAPGSFLMHVIQQLRQECELPHVVQIDVEATRGSAWIEGMVRRQPVQQRVDRLMRC